MTCKVKDCKNSANHRTQYPTQEQKHFFKAREHRYYICDECEDEGWKYNCIGDEYYFSPPKVTKITINDPDDGSWVGR